MTAYPAASNFLNYFVMLCPRSQRLTLIDANYVCVCAHTFPAHTSKRTGLYVLFWLKSMAACQRAVERNRCQSVYVVRVVDYLHYPVEKAQYVGRWVAIFASVYYLHGAERAMDLARISAAGFLQALTQEVILQLSGTRKMKLDEYGGRAGWLRNLFRQCFLEGACYFTTAFGMSIHVRLGAVCTWQFALHAVALFGFPLWSLAHGIIHHKDPRHLLSLEREANTQPPIPHFPTNAVSRKGRTRQCSPPPPSLCAGWPKPRLYGGKQLSQRSMLETMPARAGQLAVGFYYYSQCTDSGKRWMQWMALVQLVHFPTFFYSIRALGRSYVQVQDFGAERGRPPHWLVDHYWTLFRAAEPIIGGFFLLTTTSRLTGFVYGDDHTYRH